jgi:hypothetical protein
MTEASIELFVQIMLKYPAEHEVVQTDYTHVIQDDQSPSKMHRVYIRSKMVMSRGNKMSDAITKLT